ncbi:hypothetical protein LOCC1_G007271 [Lachnellula occidentalis]|uniref:Lincomycin-condensing protein lmbA n=1 Tax=Lachnellula occidentalis TaxID=215460 RepID=A0A8H8RK89_9HELO|nr:hypothetical protein LOCC1_G007271 [Lachnellula occidentalis]
MASFTQSIYECLFGAEYHEVDTASDEKTKAADVLRVLFSETEGREHLKKSVQDIVSTTGWTEKIAEHILDGIKNALKQGAQMGKTMTEASNKAIAEAAGFAQDHEFLCALIAVGVLAILMPWVLEALGFAELGPVEGTFAAWWQSTYRGYVTKDSLFAFFQRLGMVWH